MMAAALWLSVALLPLLAALLVLLFRRVLALPWLWLSCVPAAVAVIWPAEPVQVDFLWPDVLLGGRDLVTRGWLGFTTLIWICAGVYARATLSEQPRYRRFCFFWLISLGGNLLLIIAQDALSFYVGFSLMGIAAYGLVVYKLTSQARRAARIYLELTILSEMLLFAGMVMLVHSGGAVSFEQLQLAALDPLTLTLILLGLMIKAGFWPLHVWLPLAHVEAPVPASAVLSGTMTAAGVLGLWRFLPVGDPLLQAWTGPLVAVGLFSAFYGVAMGLLSRKAKRVLAWSTVSQMGYLLIIMALAWNNPDNLPVAAPLLVLFAAHHGMAKAGLFLSAGVVTHTHFKNRVYRLGFWLLLAVPALSLSGLPLTSGGAMKSALKHMVNESDFATALWLFKIASLGTTLLLVRALLLLWGMSPREALPPGPVHKQNQPRISWPATLPWAVLSAMSLLLPWLWPAMRQQLYGSFALSSLWSLLWPILAALAIAFAALRWQW